MEILWENMPSIGCCFGRVLIEIVDTSLDGRRKEMRRGEKVPHI
jgi:hypothetical protein